jgi:hypothetical protein
MTMSKKKFYHFSRAVTVGEYYTVLADSEEEARAKLDSKEENEDYDTRIVEKSDYFSLDKVEDNEWK